MRSILGDAVGCTFLHTNIDCSTVNNHYIDILFLKSKTRNNQTHTNTNYHTIGIKEIATRIFEIDLLKKPKTKQGFQALLYELLDTKILGEEKAQVSLLVNVNNTRRDRHKRRRC